MERTKQILMACLASLLLAPMGASSPVEVHEPSSGLGDECASTGDGQRTTILDQDDWELTSTPDGQREARQTTTIRFASWNNSLVALDGAGDPDVGLQNCSAGVCTVVVHVYEEVVASVETHAGFYAFLPWAFGKVTMQQQVNVTTESEIACSGEAFIVLTGSGGMGPRTMTASIWKTEGSQEYKTCSYLNIPRVDETCDIVFSKDFELAARTPGEYTRFDIVNGGRLSNRMSAQVASTAIDVVETPEVDIMGTGIGSLQPGNGGQWRAVLAAINVEADTTEAVEMLREAKIRPTLALN